MGSKSPASVRFRGYIFFGTMGLLIDGIASTKSASNAIITPTSEKKNPSNPPLTGFVLRHIPRMALTTACKIKAKIISIVAALYVFSKKCQQHSLFLFGDATYV